MVTDSEVRQQSVSCYKQWSDQWRVQAKYHGDRFTMKPLSDFEFSGVGKAALLVGNGYSFEEDIETIKKYQDKVDIVACDKTLKSLIEHDITPDICILCDANVSYQKYCEPIKDKLKDTILISNICAATEWACRGNWKDVYFFVNQDILQSEKEWMEVSKCSNLIVAGTNVSNAMIIMLTQCSNAGARNFFGYDRILLTGFDYCWDETAYYAFDKTGGGKEHYMKHIMVISMNEEIAFSSGNLLFSCRWIDQYLKVFKLNIIQTSKRSILPGNSYLPLEKAMNYSYRTEDSHFIKKLVKMRDAALTEIREIDQKLIGINFDHAVASLT